MVSVTTTSLIQKFFNQKEFFDANFLFWSIFGPLIRIFNQKAFQQIVCKGLLPEWEKTETVRATVSAGAGAWKESQDSRSKAGLPSFRNLQGKGGEEEDCNELVLGALDHFQFANYHCFIKL